jgi:glutamine synthetase
VVEKKENFALENQIKIIIGKERKDLTRNDFIKLILEKEIERITFHYTGIDGKLKELKLPVSNKKYAELILTEGERVDGSSLFKGMIDPGRSDLYVVPQYHTAFINPFDSKSLDFVCRFFNQEGNLADFTPDNILYRASKMLKQKTGYELWALGELEFYLLSNFENETYPLPKQTGYHASSPYVKNSDVVNDIIKRIAKIGGNVKYAHNEVGYLPTVQSEIAELNGKAAEQVEIEFLPDPIEDMSDMLVLSRWIIRNVAYRNNCVATFVPKLEIGHAGSGMHVHMALMKNGKNKTVDSKGNLSNDALKIIGGLCHYAPSLNAFGNMVSASYLRLVPHQEAPTKVCWSALNRSAMIRVPLGWTNISNLSQKINPGKSTNLKNLDSRQTVELRSPDGSCNTHLLFAGIAVAVGWGLENGKKALELAKKSHVKGDINKIQNSKSIKNLPQSCVESAEILLKNRKIFERDNLFPERVIDFVAKQLQNEKDRNLNERLLKLSDNDKMKESRRLMHRDIHKH